MGAVHETGVQLDKTRRSTGCMGKQILRPYYGSVVYVSWVQVLRRKRGRGEHLTALWPFAFALAVYLGCTASGG